MRRKKHRHPPNTTQPPETAGGDVRWLIILGARHNNLKNLDVHVPLRRFVCVTGVSGSGKSSLVNDIIRERLARDLNGAEKVHPGKHDDIRGAEHLDKVVDINQSPIGRTPRSNPATYIKVFDQIRALYARLPDSKVRGYKPGRFSFNVPGGPTGGGRCEACEGNGANRVEMDFLADIWVTCPVCEGHRFTRETLQILFKGKSIADVLEMDVGQALEHFGQIPKIAAMLQTLHDVGLDYIKLGQSSTTLSGGEAQRIKLARELVKKSTGSTLYLLDEPTTGLHFDDIKKLLAVLHGFVDAGNTVVVIEHNLDVIKTADWIIDLGPEGGENGGWIVAEGTPEHTTTVKESYTGKALVPVLAKKSERSRSAKPAKTTSRSRKGARNGKANQINVVGARQHNLKDVTVGVPRGRTTIFSGPSGSGKSSLAIDTIYAEGQRRYVESLSAYARQFLGRLQKPRVDHVHGLSPAISIEQKTATKSPRSTVGTVTEIYDYMRVLWARIATPYCPTCRIPIGTQAVDEIVDRILSLEEGTRGLLLSPVARAANETYAHLFERERANGFTRVRIDGEIHSLDETVPVDERRRHAVELVVDRIAVKSGSRARITDSVEQALAIGNGVIRFQIVSPNGNAPRRADGEHRFSQLHSCERCGRGYDELTPHHFSFNTRMGWCDACEGLGVQRGASPEAVAVHPTRSILDGALSGWENAPANRAMTAALRALAEHIGFDPDTPWRELDESHRLAVLHGCGDDWIAMPPPGNGDDASWRNIRFKWRGYFPAIDRATRTSWLYRKLVGELVTEVPCSACGGSRLRAESRAARLGGKTIEQICHLTLDKAATFFKRLKLDPRERKIAGELLHEMTSRLRFLIDVGLEYLTLHRAAPTLSGGESQRIRLASQIGSGLTGVLYVLDEPTIGLHPRDNARLIAALSKLRDLGNTLIIVEHDRDVIDHADHVLDFGPGAGSDGGRIVAAAAPRQLRTKRRSLTGKYLAGKEAIAVPTNRREVRDDPHHPIPDRRLLIEGARHHNLKEIDVAFPLGRFIVVTGVSGSGKSSLVTDTLHNALAARIHRARLLAGAHTRITGIEHIDKVVNVDQSPIGNSPSSNPATYTGLFDAVRELFAKLPDSKVRGYTANRFSFNRPGGRCEACEGNGQQCIEMHFLPDVWIDCESCGGTRYLQETLEVKYRGKNIADVLAMRISQALDHFASIAKVHRMLQMLDDVGLGYLPLGQAAPTLSGGEAQRVKLAAELGRPSSGKTLYILDEPTTGLHFDDLRKLLTVLHRLVDLGNTVVCIEHNLDVIKTADHVIDIGPEAAAAGGSVVAAGTPEHVASVDASHTGRALAPILDAGPQRLREVYDPEHRRAEERELEGPLDLGKADAAHAKMPWEIDGRKWHTVSHRDRRGQLVQWDPKLLEWLVETIERIPGFEPADWNDRARVEIKAPGAKTMWFAHILTGGRDLLQLMLRVPARRFDNKTVVRRLKVPTLDERDDLPIYGQWSRAQLRAAGRDYDVIRIDLRDFKDVDQTAFKRFFADAADAYFYKVKELATDPVKGQPWKVDGRKWHLSQQSINAHHTIRWKPSLLLELIGRINKLDPEIVYDWNGKIAVGLHRLGDSRARLGKIVTNMGEGLRCDLRVPRNRFTPLQIEKLGRNPSIRPRRDHDQLTFWLRSLSQNDTSQFAAVLAAMRETGREKESA